MTKRGRLLVISGPSGVGKGTLCKILMDRNDGIDYSISMTTRKPREGEVDGKNYFFTDTETFERHIERNGFLEYASVYGNYYGTPKAHVMEMLDSGRDVILEIDTQGAMLIKETYPEGVFIFILPPSLKELRKRIETRASDDRDVIERRLGEAMNEISRAPQYDYIVVNDDINDAVEKLSSIVTAEHAKVSEEINEIIDRFKEELEL